MSFFKKLGRGAGAFVTLGGSEAAIRRRKKKKQEEADKEAANLAIGEERKSLLSKGMQQGRDRAAELTGQTGAETGADVSSIVKRRRENMNAPSRAASEIRARGQQSARRMRAAGGSDAQQRQNEIEVARMAGMQEDQDNERRTAQFQDLMGNIMATQSALEPAYGALQVSSQYIAPPKKEKSTFSKLLDPANIL